MSTAVSPTIDRLTDMRRRGCIIIQKLIYWNVFARHSVTKPIRFLGSSLDDLRAFPTSARKEAGYQLDKVQNGEPPSDWK